MTHRILVLYGSYRSDRMGIRLAHFVIDGLRGRGDDVELIDAKEVGLPMLDRMYKEHPKGQAPAALEALAGKIRDADGFLFVTGEYNWGIQPGLKNLTDHFLEEWFWRPAAIASYSAGRFAGARAATAWHGTLSEMGMVVVSSTISAGPIAQTLSAEGKPIGEGGKALERAFPRFADDFTWWIEAAKAQRGALDFPDLVARAAALLTQSGAAAWVLYTVPRRAYTMFPTAAVIGALMGLGQLAATSELTALRALGLSRKRLSVSVAIALSLLTAVMVFSAETLGPWGQDRADALKSSAKWGRDIATSRYSGLWAREGDTFLNAQSGEEQLVGDKGTRLILRDVRLYRIAENGGIASLTHADTAEHDRDGWVLTGVRRDTFGERSATRQEVAREPWNSKLDAAALATGIAKPRNLSLAELSTSITYRQRNGLDARDFEDVYWSRWFYPLNVLALCLAAVPFAFGSLRSGGMGKRLFLGILFALGFWLLQLFFGRMAGALKFDYRIAYALPPIVMLAVSGLLFRRKSG